MTSSQRYNNKMDKVFTKSTKLKELNDAVTYLKSELGSFQQEELDRIVKLALEIK